MQLSEDEKPGMEKLLRVAYPGIQLTRFVRVETHSWDIADVAGIADSDGEEADDGMGVTDSDSDEDISSMSGDDMSSDD